MLSLATCSYGVDSSTLTAAWGTPIDATSGDAARVLTRGIEILRRSSETGVVRISITEAEATSALSIGLLVGDITQVVGRIPAHEIQAVSDLDALRELIWSEAERQRAELAQRSGWWARALSTLDPKIRTGDVQVRFERTGEIVAAGYVQAWRFRLPGLLVAAPAASEGTMTLDFVSGRLGRMPLPEPVFDWLGRAIAGGVLLGDEYVQVTEISVADGSMTLSARLAR